MHFRSGKNLNKKDKFLNENFPRNLHKCTRAMGKDDKTGKTTAAMM